MPDKVPSADIQPSSIINEEQPEKYVPDGEAQNGVKKVEAITLSWSRNELIIAYIWCVQPSVPLQSIIL